VNINGDATVLKLYHNDMSVCAQKVRLTLAEKGLEWESRYVWLEKGEQLSEAFTRLNPKQVVPVLVHDGRVVTESTVICEYLDEVFEAPPLMPADPYWRARKRLWTKRLDEAVHLPHTPALCFAIAFRHLLLPRLDTPEKREAHYARLGNPVMREMQRQTLEQGLEAPAFRAAVRYFDDLLADMDAQLGETAWLAGDVFSLADIGYAPYIHRLFDLRLAPMFEQRPRVKAWYERLCARPSWQPAMSGWQDPAWVEMMQAAGREAWPAVERAWRAAG